MWYVKFIKRIAWCLVGVLFIIGALFIALDFNNVKSSLKPTVKEESTTESSTIESSAESIDVSQFGEIPAIAKSNSWQLRLVNNKNKLSSNINVKLLTMANGEKIDERIFSNYSDMVADAASQGINLASISGYRSINDQTDVYNSSVQSYEATGDSEDDAKSKTEDYIAQPGGSEHATGLAIDIVDADWKANNKPLDSTFDSTDTAKWLANYAYKYGFVLRYPKDKEAKTGIKYESWHYRFVGKASAEYMKRNNLCLEEYVQLLKEQGL